MYERILVPLDGTPLAEAVLPHVIEMARQMGAEIILFRAVVPKEERAGSGKDQGQPGYVDRQLERAQFEAEAYLHQVAMQLKAEGLSVRTAVGVGEPSRGIVKTAEKTDADVIAMASHCRTGWERLIHGSVAVKVLRTSARPLVLVGPEQKAA